MQSTEDIRSVGKRAFALQQSGEWHAAAALYETLLAKDPTVWAATYNLALVMQAMARHDEAIALYRRTVALNPNFAPAYTNLGNALRAASDMHEGARFLARAAELDPDLVEANESLGMVYQDSGQHLRAIPYFRRVLTRAPQKETVWDNLIRCQICIGDWESAIESFLEWEGIGMESLEKTALALALVRNMGDVTREQRYLDLVQRWPFPEAKPSQLSAIIGMLNYFDISRQALLATYQRYAALSAVLGQDHSSAASTAIARPTEDSRIRLGYVSGDFRQHVMGRLIEKILSHHDRTRFSITLFSNTPTAEHDMLTSAMRALADEFVDLTALSDAAAVAAIKSQAIDVLIDLGGHTSGGRPALFATRCATVTVTHLGYHGCLGLTTVDYKLSDSIVDAADAADYQIEQPYRLKSCVFPLFPTRLADDAPGFPAPTGLHSKFVFAAFTNVLKLSPRCLAVWKRVLDAIPEACLLFSPFDTNEVRVLERITSAAGIARSRIEIMPVDKRHPHLAARYALVDAVLDTFPYAGGDTTLAALSMDVPVVTLTGQRHSERMGESILRHIGMDTLVAHTEDDFIAIAVRLATDASFRETTRTTIRHAMDRAAANPAEHTHSLEAAFIDMVALSQHKNS